MIYTSYYNRRDKGEGKYIAISRTFPKWLNKEDYVHLPCVSPSHELRERYKNKEIDFNTFCNLFFKELKLEDMERLIAEIPQEGDCYILCHEKNQCDCHRYVISSILNKIGYTCEEYGR